MTLTWNPFVQHLLIALQTTVTLVPPTPSPLPLYSSITTSRSCFPIAVHPPMFSVSRIRVLMQLCSVYVSVTVQCLLAPPTKTKNPPKNSSLATPHLSTDPQRTLHTRKKQAKDPNENPTHTSFTRSARATTTCQLASCFDVPSCTNSTRTRQLACVRSTGSRKTSSGAPLWKAPLPSREGRRKMAVAQS